VNALPVIAGPGLVTGHAGAAADGVVYWDPGALRWLPLPGRPVPAEPDPAGLVAVTFTKAEVVALFGLLQWANQRSLGLAVQGDVRDAWVRLSLAYGQSRPGIDPQFAETTSSATA
jgi:hypothetical protein